MNKTKKIFLIVTIMTIILSVLFGVYVNADDNTKCKLTENSGAKDTVVLNEAALLGYSNVYCVEQGEYVAGAYDVATTFTAVSKATIKGTEVTFEEYGSNGNITSTSNYNSTLTHQIAAVLNNVGYSNNDANVGYGSGGVVTSGNYTPSEVQIALWYRWNDWVSEINNYGINVNGLESKDSNKIIKDYESKLSITRENAWNNRINNMEENIVYGAEIYFLKGPTSANCQNLILVNTSTMKRIKITKIWDDSANRSFRPTSVKFEVRVGGTKGVIQGSEKVSEITLTGSKNATSWTGWIDVPRWGAFWLYEVPDGKTEICYQSNVGDDETWKDFDGDGNKEWKVTNKLNITSFTVKKVWDDEDNVEGFRTSYINVLLKNDKGELVGNETLNADNNWTYTFTGLPKYYADRTQVKYEVIEENVPNEYETNYDKNSNSCTITNIHKPEKVNLEVKKVWEDQDNVDEYRPTSIYAALYKNEEYVESKILNESNNWSYTWENLYKNENGQEISYTIKETVNTSANSAETVPEYEEPIYEKEVKTENDITTILYTITNQHTIQYDGYIEINGKVWLDKPEGKGNEIDGIYKEGGESTDKGLAGIKVTLKDSSGNQFDVTSTAITDENGNYTIRVNYDNSKNVYKLYDNSTNVKTKLQTAYVEFEYNGNKYTTVKDVTIGNESNLDILSSTDKSKATENSEQRNAFDEAHGTTGPNTLKSTEWTDKVTAQTIAMKNYDNNTCATTTKRNETIKYCNGNGTYIRTNPSGAWNEILNGQEDLATHTDHETSEHTNEGHSMRTWEVEVEIINNINLGLFEREQPEVSIIEDISNVEIQMNGQSYKYLYNVKSDKYANAEIKAKFQNKDTYTYRRPVNPADIAYIQEPANNNLMKAYVTYDVKIGNLSTTLPIKVNEIINAYDSQYTLISVSKGHTYGESEKQGFNTINIEELQMTVQPGQESEAIQIRYEISTEALIGLLNKEATLNNAVEIINYTTYYGENTLYAEQQTGGRTNNKYGGRYDAEQPGNAGFYINEEGRIDIQNDEFDTDIAPSFVLEPDTDYKKLSGTVWQDTDANTTDNNRIGNGKQDEDAKNVKGVRVELYEVKDDGSLVLAKLYRINTDTAAVESKDAIAITDENGNYSFGDAEYGVVTDKYVIKYTYGEGTTIEDVVISARNYKSTIISTENETLYNVFKGTSTSDEWHLDLNKEINYSIAVDDVNLRIETESDLKYSNFNEIMNMVAYSKPFEMQVEFDTDTENSRYEGKVGEDGESEYGNELSVFDFGIIERPREDIFVETSIDYLKVTLANGQVLTEGNPKAESLSYVKAIGFNQNIENGNNARMALDKQSIIEIDSELIQGATLDVRYEIKVTNNGEIDYDYSKGTEYYYFGTNTENVPVITNSVNKLVYYMDNDLVWTVDNEKWTQKSADELFNDGLISENTKNSLSDNYTAFITEQFVNIAPKDAGENVKTDYISAKKMLANSDDNKFDNHAEILEIDAQTARTINCIGENSIPQVKTYKMGNYIPSTTNRVINTDINNETAGLHEQDDDRITLVITPPTGNTIYVITYIIAGLIGLTILVVGVIFIKKKVLSK